MMQTDVTYKTRGSRLIVSPFAATREHWLVVEVKIERFGLAMRTDHRVQGILPSKLPQSRMEV